MNKLKFSNDSSCLATYIIILLSFFSHFLACGQNASDIQSRLNENEIAIEYIAHACFKIHTKKHSILLDPYADKIWLGYNFPKNIGADAVFSTHPHYDHDGGIFRGITPYWEDNIDLYQDAGEYRVGEFLVTGIPGKHAEPYGKEFGQKNLIWIIEVLGIRIAHWGDNGPITDTLLTALHDIDILMLPIDDEDHILKKDELSQIIQKINPGILVPMHYRLDDLEDEGNPSNLGSIDQFVATSENVLQLGKHIKVFSKNKHSETMMTIVFQHSPIVTK